MAARTNSIGKDGLNGKQRAFVDAYEKLNWSRATAAAKAAGYNHAGFQVGRILATPAIQAAIEVRQAEERRRHNLDVDWVLNRLKNIANGSLGDVLLKLQEHDYDLSVLSLDERELISEYTEDYYMDPVKGKGEPQYDPETGEHIGGQRCVKKVKLKFHSKLDALEKLCRHLGLYKNEDGQKVEISIVERLQAARTNLKAKGD